MLCSPGDTKPLAGHDQGALAARLKSSSEESLHANVSDIPPTLCLRPGVKAVLFISEPLVGSARVSCSQVWVSDKEMDLS